MVALPYLKSLVGALALGDLNHLDPNGQSPLPLSLQNDHSPVNDLPFSPPVYPSPQGGRTADDQWKEAYSRARQFVSQLSLAEKVNLTSGVQKNGPCTGSTGDLPNQENMWGLCMADGPLGIRGTDFVTGFPPGISAGASFNKQLIRERGKVIANEFYKKGADILLGPVVGPMGLVARDGRGFEAFGADPYLQGIAAAETVEAHQSMGVMANAKHFIANEQENDRRIISSNLGDRALHEMYVWPFADMIRAGVGSVMCSYNLVNNSYACENSYTLNKVLKDELGFQGFVMSDWEATHSGVNAVTSGLDMEMPGDGFFSSNLTAGVLNGTIPIERLDDMVTRIMAAFYKTDLDKSRAERGGPNFSFHTDDDEDYLYHQAQYGPRVKVNHHVDTRSEDSYRIAYQSGLESVILLKNDKNVLPLQGDNKPKSIAVLGAAAHLNSKGSSCSFSGCRSKDQVTGGTQLGGGSGVTKYPYFVTPYDGVSRRARKDWITVEANVDTDTTTEEFDYAARNADVNIIFGLSNSGEAVDRESTGLWLDGEDTILAAAARHSKNVVVINSVGPVDMSSWINHENITAVVFALPGGQDTGDVLAEVLFGDYSPSGRLPFTLAKSEADYFPPVESEPASNGFPQDDQIGKADLFVDYRHFDYYGIEPLYEFGYGLSYSTFGFSDLRITEIKKPSRDLPPPAPLSSLYEFQSKVPSPEELLFPKKDQFDRVPGYLYPYLENADEGKPHGEYPFPEGYSTTQKDTQSLAGGASGGNPALWETAYEVHVAVRNDGTVDSHHVPQLYIEYPASEEYPTPPRQLRGFEKLFLKSGESQIVKYAIRTRDLTVWDVKTASWIVLSGEYKVHVGSSSRDLELTGSILI